jgi:hypothetical protein
MEKNIKQKNIENFEIDVSRSTSNGITKIKKQKGYAILFTVIIIGAISALTAGLSNTIFKQLILSSLVKSSQSAFYQADTAWDCALYADLVNPSDIVNTEGHWTCGNSNLNISPTGGGSYTIYPAIEDSTTPCFRIDVTKTKNQIEPTVTDTQILAKGYNICDKSNPRVVEREIEINY